MSEMTRQEVLEIVKKTVAKVLKISKKKIQSDSRYIDDLGADSVKVIEIISALEGEFHAEIDDEDIEELTTIKKTVNYIIENIAVR